MSRVEPLCLLGEVKEVLAGLRVESAGVLVGGSGGVGVERGGGGVGVEGSGGGVGVKGGGGAGEGSVGGEGGWLRVQKGWRWLGLPVEGAVVVVAAVVSDEELLGLSGSSGIGWLVALREIGHIIHHSSPSK